MLDVGVTLVGSSSKLDVLVVAEIHVKKIIIMTK
jgi:hypothetical protein